MGQFLTPQAIGTFMASLFEARPAEIRLLDAGAGDGALTAAFVKKLSVAATAKADLCDRLRAGRGNRPRT